jgi:flagellar biosynthesis chaperone FliJ
MFNTLDEKYLFTLIPDEKGGAAEPSPAEETDEPESDVEPEADVEDEPVKEPAPGVGPKKKPEGPPVGTPRWNQIYKKSKDADKYAVHGSPEKVAQDLARLHRYDEQIAAAEKKGTGDSEETDEIREQRAKVKAQLVKMFPWLEDGEKAVAHQARHIESLRNRAGEATVEVMEEQGLEVDQESYEAFMGVLQEIIGRDRRLYTLWASDPERAVKEAAKKYAEPFKSTEVRKSNAALIKGKEPHKALPKSAPRSAGGPSPGPAKAEPKTIKEAEDLFITGLKQVNRG